MKGFKVKEKLKKSLIITIIAVMMAFVMPVKSEAKVAGVINDFIDLILMIPDGCMHLIDKFIGGSEEFTYETLELYGGADKNGEIYNFIVTPYDIFSSGSYEDKNGAYYTKLGILDINFFADRDIESETIVSSEILAPVIGNVYKALRNLCMILMMLVILYIGIRIMVSSIAAQQAKYKQLLVDWVVGFALLFVMHYIMAGIVYLNSVVVKMLSNEEGDSYYVGISELEDTVVSSTHTTDSEWFDVVAGVTDGFFDGDKYQNFKDKRLIVRNSVAENGTFSNVGVSGGGNVSYIDSDGRIDLESVPKGKQDDGAKVFGFIRVSDTELSLSNKGYVGADATKWGENGVIYLAASIVNPGDNNEQYENKAIVRFNTVSYVRTISCYGSTGAVWGQPVYLYGNGGKYRASDATVMGFSILYVCIVVETIMFTFVYIKRVLQLAFLTMIAPVVAIMYPVDKIGDGKAQAFNTWFKDYLFNILIQPMHLLLYTVFIVAATQLISRNIIYALAIYGFMIPAEKYFKKLLGFEKASTGGGGPLGSAIGRGLAMDGLGKLAGIGPAGRRGGKGGSDGKGRTKIKTKKNSPTNRPVSDGTGMPSSGGGAGSQGGSPLGGGSQAGGSGRRNGQGMPNAQGRRGRPNASGSRGPLGRAGRIIGRGITRAVTGGEYNHLTDQNGGNKAWKRYVGRGAGRMITRGAGVVLGGAVGITAGAATAMATGDVQNLWKGAAVGAGAGNKLSSNLYDKGANLISGFDRDMRQERANEDEDYNAEIRTEEAYKALDEELYNLPQTERENYEKMIDAMAPYVNIKTIEDAKALHKMKEEYNDHRGSEPELTDTELKDLYDESSGMDVASHRDAYLKKKLMSFGKTESEAETIIQARPAKPEDHPDYAIYQKAVNCANTVEVAQSIRK